MHRFAEAVRLHQLGQNAEARRLCTRMLQKEPSNVQVLALHGTVCAILGERTEAIKSFRRAAGIQPDYAPFSYMLGNLLRETGQSQAAAESYRRAVNQDPGFVDAWLNLGIALHEGERREEEIACYRRALEINPLYSPAWYNLGNALQSAEQYIESIACYERALGLKPDDTDSLFNIANALLASGRLAEAIEYYERVCDLVPRHVAAHANKAVALRRCGRMVEALGALDVALLLDGGDVLALATKGNVLADIGALSAAAETLERAIGLSPQNAEALFNLGNVFHRSRQFEKSLEMLQRACVLKPDVPRFLGSLTGTRMALWNADGILDSWNRLLQSWGSGQYVPMDVVLERTDDPAMHRQCAARHAEALRETMSPAVTTKRRAIPFSRNSPRYRIAYLSPDFGEHPVGQSIVEVIERHDRSRFEVVGLSLRRHPASELTVRLATAFSSFHDMESLDVYQKIQFSEELGLDLLVDLAGYTADACPAMLAARPAPVLASYLGFASTHGAPWMDYLIADQYVVPEREVAQYAERIVWLPDSFFPSDSTQSPAETAADRMREGLPATAFVYCCFNNPKRVTPELMEIWMAVLRETENSVLWLQRTNETSAKNMLRFARERGVDGSRLVFARFASTRTEHLARHRLADLYLDTFPYNGHSTARDALYAGVPLLTLSGRSFASRVAGSLLTALRLPDLITTEYSQYKELAVELTQSPRRLQDLRELLWTRRQATPVFNMSRLTEHLERSYSAMIERSREGRPPSHLKVETESVTWGEQ